MQPNRYIINSNYAQLRIDDKLKLQLYLPATIPAGAEYTVVTTSTSASQVFDWSCRTSEGIYTTNAFPILHYLTATGGTAYVSTRFLFDGTTFTCYFKNNESGAIHRDTPITLNITVMQFVSPFEA